MNGKKSPQFDSLIELIQLVLNEAASDERRLQLQTRLEASEEDRQVYLHHVNLHSALRRQFAFDGQEETPSQHNWITVRNTTRDGFTSLGTRLVNWSLVLTAAIVLIITGYYLSCVNRESEIATITEWNGPLQWTGSNGQVVGGLRVGSPLSAGTLESLSADSWAVLTFCDGSTATVSGISELTISQQRQKELRLRKGMLSASVTPQPAGKPMLVHTPTAELEVLGTQFNVDADNSATRLAVNEGLVRLKRLTDGRVVEVPAEHQTVVSLDQNNGLAVTALGRGTGIWPSDLARDVVYGKWVSNITMLAIKLKKAVATDKMTKAEATAKYKEAAILDESTGSVWAVPFLEKSKQSYKKSTVGHLIVLSVSRGQSGPVVLANGARLHIQGRLYSPTAVEFGISTNAPGGGFSGKYVAKRPAVAFGGDEHAFDIEIPLSEFRATDSWFDESPVGKDLVNWWCFAKSKETKLEILHVELLPPEETD